MKLLMVPVLLTLISVAANANDNCHNQLKNSLIIQEIFKIHDGASNPTIEAFKKIKSISSTVELWDTSTADDDLYLRKWVVVSKNQGKKDCKILSLTQYDIIDLEK